jgi:hypothetical protein
LSADQVSGGTDTGGAGGAGGNGGNAENLGEGTNNTDTGGASGAGGAGGAGDATAAGGAEVKANRSLKSLCRIDNGWMVESQWFDTDHLRLNPAGQYSPEGPAIGPPGHRLPRPTSGAWIGLRPDALTPGLSDKGSSAADRADVRLGFGSAVAGMALTYPTIALGSSRPGKSQCGGSATPSTPPGRGTGASRKPPEASRSRSDRSPPPSAEALGASPAAEPARYLGNAAAG